VKSILDDRQDKITKKVWTRRDAVSFGAMYERLLRFAGAVGPWEIEPEDLFRSAYRRVGWAAIDSVSPSHGYGCDLWL